MRIAFLGTPDFALPSLEMLYRDGHELCVFTQPDRPKGRGKTLSPPPVKELALKYGIPVFQPERIKRPEGVELLRTFAPELMVTAAFGQMLSQENLDIPKYGCINVHGSLLPKYRGAAPVQWAIINGERVTGVTTMLTDAGLDTGDMLMKAQTPIGEDETAGDLFERLSVMGAQLLKSTIDALENGTLTRAKQDGSEATKCSLITKEHGKIDFSLPSKNIHDLVRGMDPWPAAYALMDGETVKIWKTRMCTEAVPSGKPGHIELADPKRGLFVATGDGVIQITELQLPGAKRMSANALLAGRRLTAGEFS